MKLLVIVVAAAWRRLWLMAALTATAGPLPALDDGVLRIEKWRVQAGDDPRWAAPDFDDRDWRAGTLPGERLAGFHWYRSSVTVPAEWAYESLALAFGPMGEAFEVWVDGVSVGRLGRWEPAPVSAFVRHLAFHIPAHGDTLRIAVRRWRSLTSPYFYVLQLPGNGYFSHVPELGPARLMQTRERLHAVEGEKAAALTLGMILFGGLAGLVSLGLFLQRRSQREYLWLGAGLALHAVVIVMILLAVKLDWPVRSAVPTLAIVLDWLAYGCLALLLGELCPRLRWLADVLASLWLVLGGYSAVGMMANTALNLTPFQVVQWATALTHVLAAALLWRVDRHGFALAASLLLTPVARALVFSEIISGRADVWGAPVDPDQVALALFAVTALTILYLRSREAERERQGREQELAAGQRVQLALLESGADGTPGYTVDKAYLPAREVGGDFYQTFATPGGGLLLVVGDVSGKGLEAAMKGAALLGALELVKDLPPGQVLARLNEALLSRWQGGFVTCRCALLATDGTVTLANAGHPAPYVDGAEVETEAGLPLGVVTGAEYAESRLLLGARAMTFVSDGVVEAENSARELFGFDRTREMSKRPAQEIAEAARAWGQNDDITVVTVRRRAG